MLKRKLTEYIEHYYDSTNRALLLTGARQTGKTYAARQFGKRYKNFIEINFIEQPAAVNLFKNVAGADEILLRL